MRAPSHPFCDTRGRDRIFHLEPSARFAVGPLRSWGLALLLVLWAGAADRSLEAQTVEPGLAGVGGEGEETALNEIHPVEILLSWPRESPPPEGELQIQFWRIDTQGEMTEPRIESLARAPGSARVALPAGRWRVAVGDSAFFAEGLVQIGDRDGGEGAQIRLTVVPAAWVLATIVVPKGEDLPRTARLHVTASPAAAPDESSDSSKITAAATTCPVSKRGWLECKVPRGRFDLRLDFPGFASLYRRQQKLEERVQLGMIALRPGASPRGWIVAPDPGARGSPSGARGFGEDPRSEGSSRLGIAELVAQPGPGQSLLALDRAF